jgi:hypothetical protein
MSNSYWAYDDKCGPPIYRRFSCVRCRKMAAVIKTHGRRQYCDECRQIVPREAAAAIARVHTAIRRGQLPAISSCTCVDCGKQAEIYEHRRYADALEVEPVCRSCNGKRGASWWGEAKYIRPYFLEPSPL